MAIDDATANDTHEEDSVPPMLAAQGYTTPRLLARGIGAGPRTVFRYMAMPDGLPSTIFAGRSYIHVATALAWLEARGARRRNPRRTARQR